MVSKHNISRILVGLNFICFLLSLQSCNCDVEELAIKRTDYAGNAMRMDGYYYYLVINSSKDTSYSFSIYYRNGVLIYGGTMPSIEEVDELIVSPKYLENLKADRRDWGVYIIIGDSLLKETWWSYPRMSCKTGGNLVGSDSWKIENDTTLINLYTNKGMYFRPFSPKPDSTNNFIE